MAGFDVVGVKGLTDLRWALRRAGGDLHKKLREPNKRAATIVAEEAQSRAPVRSGRLKASIRALASQTSARVAAGSASLPYAMVQEFGWPGHNIEAQPYIYPAITATNEKVVDAYDGFLGELFSEAFPS